MSPEGAPGAPAGDMPTVTRPAPTRTWDQSGHQRTAQSPAHIPVHPGTILLEIQNWTSVFTWWVSSWLYWDREDKWTDYSGTDRLSEQVEVEQTG